MRVGVFKEASEGIFKSLENVLDLQKERVVSLLGDQMGLTIFIFKVEALTQYMTVGDVLYNSEELERAAFQDSNYLFIPTATSGAYLKWNLDKTILAYSQNALIYKVSVSMQTMTAQKLDFTHSRAPEEGVWMGEFARARVVVESATLTPTDLILVLIPSCLEASENLRRGRERGARTHTIARLLQNNRDRTLRDLRETLSREEMGAVVVAFSGHNSMSDLALLAQSSDDAFPLAFDVNNIQVQDEARTRVSLQASNFLYIVSDGLQRDVTTGRSSPDHGWTEPLPVDHYVQL